MAGIQLASNFDLSSPLPLDSRLQVENMTERNAIPSGKRYEGMSVYVKSEQKTYSLKGGIENSNFKEIVTEESIQALTSQLQQLEAELNSSEIDGGYFGDVVGDDVIDMGEF